MKIIFVPNYLGQNTNNTNTPNSAKNPKYTNIWYL